MAEGNLLELRNITKSFPGVKALDDVSLSVRRGEVHALVGENGAGKSTLIKTIAGAITPDSGTIIVDGASYSVMTPKLSRSLGIEVIYQEYNLVDTLSVAENIYLGSFHGVFADFKDMQQKTEEIFRSFHVTIDSETQVKDLSSAMKQLVEIMKAVSKNVRLLIMDEPTAALTVDEVAIMMDVVCRLREQGVGILYISHRLDEIFQIADRVTIMRDGTYVDTRDVADINRQDLINMMVGRELNTTYPRREHAIGPVCLRVEHLCGNGDEDISFELHQGEILGVAGLVGAGRTELAQLLYGAVPIESGDTFIAGEKVCIRSPKDALTHGIGMVPEDRKQQGCILDKSVKFNISIGNIRQIAKRSLIDSAAETALAEYYQQALSIKTPSLEQNVRNLSGGNQQKVVLGKTLAANSEIIIIDEPTRGIDVNARHEIYLLMNQLTAEGKAILMISSDMEELLGMSDRIIVLAEGRLAGEVPKQKFSQNYIMELASQSVFDK